MVYERFTIFINWLAATPVSAYQPLTNGGG